MELVELIEEWEDENSKIENPFVGDLAQTPKFIHDNKYIIRGYRIGFNNSWKIFKSLFILHNETVNIWSHIFGVCLFIGLIIYTVVYLSPPGYSKEISHGFVDGWSDTCEERSKINA